jgi:hydroxymethylbilane synthase
MLRGLGGGCQVPIGAVTNIAHGILTLRGVVLPPDGSQRVEAEVAGPMEQAELLGKSLSDDLRAGGAQELLKLS